MVCSKKRYFCKGNGEVWKSLEIYAAKWSFRVLGAEIGIKERDQRVEIREGGSFSV